MLETLILAAVFMTIVLGVLGAASYVADAPLRRHQKLIGYRVDALLRTGQHATGAGVQLFKTEAEAALPEIERMLLRLPRVQALERALRQADWQIAPLTFLLICAAAAAATGALGLLIWRWPLVAIVAAALGAALPYLYLMRRRANRLDKFLEQFPEAIDLIARAIRAGHAIATGFEMVADEMDSPVAEEFRQTYDEQKFGLPVRQALLNLQERVQLLDVTILVTAITIQREVGGNLAEVLDKIGHTIRERFKIRRQVKVYTAQGRLTGYVLGALPIFVGFMLYTLNPDYFTILFEASYGMLMIGLAILLQILGYFWIRKIIHIKI